MTKRNVNKMFSKNSTEDSKKMRIYLDQKTINANREIDQEFYGEENQYIKEPVAFNLYNLGDSTPIINDEEKK